MCLQNMITIGTLLFATGNMKMALSYHIAVEPESSLQYNGHILNSNNLHEFLDQHEKQLLFRQSHLSMQIPFKLVNVKHKSRIQRSVQDVIHIRFKNNIDGGTNHNQANQSNIDLHLRRSNKLVDDNFVFIKRDANGTKLVHDFHGLVEMYSNCFYRNENSAVDLCDSSMRGILYLNGQNLIIHPLPERFGNTFHVLYESKYNKEIIDEERLNDDASNETESSIDSKNSDSNIVRFRRSITSSSTGNVPHILYIETAIFVDKDLFRHMAKNYPKNTEKNLIRFVMAMINGVQLLYHHPSLGHQINFILKRLEILHHDPKELRRSSDIDIFLNSFCMWQRRFNPVADDNAFHFDHAVILTGLDLYVVSKNGKISSQVVGLAPVAGMCTATSSCTINEGKHFESVFVVAHEIGHNLGMRHDTAESNCDPSLFIMSPTLGSGKITWSKCSQNYLKSFLETSQAKCLFDNGQIDPILDHSAELILPGERFDADQQCMLKYGKDSIRSRVQPLKEICRDLHCQRDRYTWTSHPALEGTNCAESKWCRSGICVLKTETFDKYTAVSKPIQPESDRDNTNVIDDRKFGNLMKSEQSINRPNLISMWSEWTKLSDCESGCLFGESGRLREGSTGLKTFWRTCYDYRWSRRKCFGSDKKYETCFSKQCYNIHRTTVSEFANQICMRAKKFDPNIGGDGLRIIGEKSEHSCRVYCKSKNGLPVTKSWTFPDGTICNNRNSKNIDEEYFCVNGRCEKFTCDNSTSNYFKLDSSICNQHLLLKKIVLTNSSISTSVESERNLRNSEKIRPSATGVIQRYTRNDSELPKNVGRSSINPQKSKLNMIRVNSLRPNNRDKQINIVTPINNEWNVKSGCHFSCIEQSMGIQIISSNLDQSTNIQLCHAEFVSCDKIETTQEFSANLCKKYQGKVRGLSGKGMQIAPSSTDPDRGCKVACQDQYLSHRFYLVNGEQGFFPFGTKCSRTSINDKRYCVNGKCLQFDERNIPFVESHISLALYRSRRSTNDSISYGHKNPTNRRFPHEMNNLSENIVKNEFFGKSTVHVDAAQNRTNEEIDLINPIYISSYYDYINRG